jgi:hypothetical protein
MYVCQNSYGNAPHKQSCLQSICAYSMVFGQQGCGIDRTFYISSDDLVDDIVDFDQKYQPPLNLYQRLMSQQSEMVISVLTEFQHFKANMLLSWSQRPGRRWRWR